MQTPSFLGHEAIFIQLVPISQSYVHYPHDSAIITLIVHDPGLLPTPQIQVRSSEYMQGKEMAR